MTVILPLGRAVTRHLFPRSNQLLTRLASTNPLLRASQYNPKDLDSCESCHGLSKKALILSAIRSYATAAAAKPAGRPKAHTGRTTAKKTTTKPRATTATKKKRTATKAKAKPKTRAKAKAKAKPKPKKRTVKKAPSASAINLARIARNKDLKAKALLAEPKQLPATAWTVYFTQNREGIKTFAEGGQKTKETAQNFKKLTPEEHEKLNHTANQNKAKNEAEYKKWVSQFTPTEVKEANNARRALNHEKKVKEGKRKSPIRLIKDDRLVKSIRNPYFFFNIDRYASGDFKNMALAEASRLIGREWKALSESEKKPYEDQAKADANRYVEEVRSVYGKEPVMKQSTKAS